MQRSVDKNDRDFFKELLQAAIKDQLEIKCYNLAIAPVPLSDPEIDILCKNLEV